MTDCWMVAIAKRLSCMLAPRFKLDGVTSGKIDQVLNGTCIHLVPHFMPPLHCYQHCCLIALWQSRRP